MGRWSVSPKAYGCDNTPCHLPVEGRCRLPAFQSSESPLFKVTQQAPSWQSLLESVSI